MPTFDPVLTTRWTYRPSPVPARVRAKRWRSWATGRLAPPAARTLRAPTPAPRWNALFLYVPTGALDADQRSILARVRALTGRLLVVCALGDRDDPVPPPVTDCADAVIVKERRGFDFSGYRLALDAVARHSPGATVYAQNDSVFGPFGEVDRLVADAPWDLAGFMASRAVENHLSAFAFALRDVTPARVAALRPVMAPAWCCDAFDDVVLLQETRLARVAARTMDVGAWWYTPARPAPRPLVRAFRARLPGAVPPPPDLAGDPTLAQPIELLEAGFPFLKRSLFGKFAGLHDPAALRAALEAQGW